MRHILLAALMLGAAAMPAPAAAQQASITQTLAGSRLDNTATGEVTRVPDVAVISAGGATRAPPATAALQQTANRMERVLAALKRAGIADRDIQTSNVNLNAEYRYPANQSPQLVGYTASNTVTIRFRDIGNSGKILDALVSEGANQINGPSLVVDKPEAALDDARGPLCAVARDAGGARRCGERERRKLSGAAADADVCASGSRTGGHEDHAGRAEAAGQPGDDVRAAVTKKAARIEPRGLQIDNCVAL